MLEEDVSQSSLVGSQEVTSITSFTQTTGRASKKSRMTMPRGSSAEMSKGGLAISSSEGSVFEATDVF